MSRWALALSLLVGCASPGNECIGATRAIGECAQGIAWADCGGTGSEPRLACAASGDCRWFANDCVAQGYEPSSCSASDTCCHSSAPYEGTTPGSARDLGITTLTRGWGTEPWDAARERNLVVTVGAIAAGTRPSIDCSDLAMLLALSACTSTSVQPSLFEQGGVVVGVVGGGGNFGGHTITLELTPDAAGTMGGRVCSVPFADTSNGTCSQPDPMLPRACAITGTVRIDELPVTAHTHVDIDATFPDGSTVSIRL